MESTNWKQIMDNLASSAIHELPLAAMEIYTPVIKCAFKIIRNA